MLPVRFGKKELTAEELKKDRKTCKKAGPCGLGRKAMYLNTFFLDRRLYVCYEDIECIYKRIAMSAGGFSGRGMFGAIPYLVVELKDGRSRQCNFKIEEDVDALMRWIRDNHPEIHLYTKQAEERMMAEIREEKTREKKLFSPSAAAGKTHLEEDLAFLEKHPEISDRLRRAVREKRRIDHIPASSRVIMGAAALIGVAGIVLGLYTAFSGKSYGLWGILSGKRAADLRKRICTHPEAEPHRRRCGGTDPDDFAGDDSSDIGMTLFLCGVRQKILIDTGDDPVLPEDLLHPLHIFALNADIVNIPVDLSFSTEISGVQLGSTAARHYSLLQIMAGTYAFDPLLLQEVSDSRPGGTVSFLKNICFLFKHSKHPICIC